MANQKLLDAFLSTKQILCENDYYICIPKKTIHVTNNENMIPHLMGMQYVGRSDMFTGDRGAYMIKKGRLKYDSLEKIVKKYYNNASKQASILAMIEGKINNLYHIKDMLSTYSVLYLYDVSANPESELKTDYLLVNYQKEMVLQLGIVKAGSRKGTKYHCNTFMVDYIKNENFDLHYRNLTRQYEMAKIVRENKITKHAEVIYQSSESKARELSGIEKMLRKDGIMPDERLIKSILCLNVKLGKYHTLEQLGDSEGLLNQCREKRETAVVKAFLNEWERTAILAKDTKRK